MGFAKGQRPGDKVVVSGHQEQGKVVKTKPDGSKVVRTKFGTLKTMKSAKKRVDRPTQH